jgi:hypothetical protein
MGKAKDYLIAFIKKPKCLDPANKRYIAVSNECGISAYANSKEEAASKLAGLLCNHVTDAFANDLNPFYSSIERIEEFGEYCLRRGIIPQRLKDVEIGDGMILAAYDMSDYE